MGLFSSREQISVATNVARVISDDKIHPSSQTAVINSIMNGGNIFDYLMDGMTNSIGTHAEQMYRYAESHYAFGMPSGEFYSAVQGQAEVQAILDSIAGTTVTIDYSHLGPANCLHMGWMKLISDYGYNPETNELTAISATKGLPVYLKNMTVVIPTSKFGSINPRAKEQWGVSPAAGHLPVEFPVDLLIGKLVGFNPVINSDTAPSEQILVEYCWSFSTLEYDPYVDEYVDRPRLTGESMVIPLSGYGQTSEYFHVRYLVGGVANYWMYELNTGTYPSLDALFNLAPTTVGEFFPFTYFRLENTSMDWNLTSDHYLTSKKMLSYLGLDYQKMIDAIKANPDIGNVRQAMMIMAVPANSTNQLDQRYLYNFFEQVRVAQTNTARSQTLAEILSNFTSTGNSFTSEAIVIQDTSFKISLSHGGVYKKRIGGVIGAVGSYSSEYIEQTAIFKANNSEGVLTNYTYVLPCHYYRKQISSGMYDEIQVINMRTTYFIYEGYNTIGDGTDDYLLVPIDRALVSPWSIPEKEALYARSLQYVFNSVNITEVAWYAQDWFRAVILAAAFIMAVYTAGTSLEAYSVMLNCSFVTTEAIIWSIVQKLVIGIVMSFGINKLVQTVGPEVGIALAIMAAAYGLASSSGLVTQLPFADTMLSVSSSLIKGAETAYSSKISDIQTEMYDLNVEAQLEASVLLKAQDLLQNDSLLSPYTIIGEDPSDYYRRTMYSGNVGQLAIDGVATFVERALTLPTLADAIGGNFNRAV